MTTATATRVPECTPEQGAQWQHDYAEGYRVGRGDARWNASPRIPLIEIPPEVPYESGATYVTRWVHLAWQIGYTRAYRYETRGN
jgi:hypothetical protein